MYISWLPHLEVEGRWCCYHKSKAANRCSLTPWGRFQTFFMVDIFHVKAYHLQVFFWPYNKVCFLKEIFSCFCGDQNRLYEAKHDVFLTLLLLVADKVWISWWHTKLVPAVYVSLPFAGFSSTKGWLEVLQSLVEEGREVWGNYKSVLFPKDHIFCWTNHHLSVNFLPLRVLTITVPGLPASATASACSAALKVAVLSKYTSWFSSREVNSVDIRLGNGMFR